MTNEEMIGVARASTVLCDAVFIVRARMLLPALANALEQALAQRNACVTHQRADAAREAADPGRSEARSEIWDLLDRIEAKIRARGTP